MLMSTRTNRIEQLFDALEPRCLLAGDALPYTLYYPEGYAHDQISEFVPITNPNDHPVAYRLLAQYETGERDQVISEGIIPANSRGGVTITSANQPQSRLVRPNEAFAIVLKTSDQVSATISHYDFQATIGQSFTDQPSTTWTFTNVQKDFDTVRDYLVFYNTSEQRANINISFLADSGEKIELTQSIGALRRGGLDVNATSTIPEGTYAVTITSDQPIVAAITHYDISLRRGFGVLGAANGGGLAGLIPAADFQDNDRLNFNDPDGDDNDGDDEDDDGQGFQDRNRGHGNDPDGFDDDNPGRGHGYGRGRRFGHGHDIDPAVPYETTTSLNILNSTDQPATVTFTFLNHEGTDDLTDPRRTVTVPADSRLSIIFDDLDFTLDSGVGIAFESDQVVTVAAMISGPRRSAAIPAITSAATEWGFGEGFLTRQRAGVSISENLYLFNPAATSAEVTIEFIFNDGTTFSTTRSVDPAAIVDVSLDSAQDLLDICEGRYFFGIRVSAANPIVATLDHLDRIMAGGFTTAGIPHGTIVPLSSVLVLPQPTPVPVPVG